MAVASTAFWRVRPSGSNTNGGGYDCGSSGGSITPAATGTAGSWATVSTTTTFTDTMAAAFTSGMVGGSINILGVGQFSVLSYVSTTQITITTPNPATSNFGNNASWAVGPGTDYSQQNSAQASGTAGVTVGTTTFTDATALAFTAAMVGNAIYITGTGQTTGFYFVTAYTSSSIVTLDRSPGTGTGATWHLGGGWADYFTNCGVSLSALTAGNTVYILGSGVPSPASYTYDYTTSPGGAMQSGSTSGLLRFIGDPATPSGGVPCLQIPWNHSLFYNTSYVYTENLWVVTTTAVSIVYGGGAGVAKNCVIDQYGHDSAGFSGCQLLGCEVFSSVTSSTGSQYAASLLSNEADSATSCNFHNCIGNGVQMAYGGRLQSSVVAKCNGNGVVLLGGGYPYQQAISNNTIDGNGGNGIVLDQSNMSRLVCTNNIISNHTTSGKYGITVSAGTPLANDLIRPIIDHNTYYNNNAHYNAITPGAHDTVLTTSPYVASSTENYTLA